MPGLADILNDPLNAEMLQNAIIDYFTTTGGVSRYGSRVEGNPIARKIFETIGVRKYPRSRKDIVDFKRRMGLLGVGYLLGLTALGSIDTPLANLLKTGINLGHFYGASTWLRHPVGKKFAVYPETRFTLYRKEF